MKIVRIVAIAAAVIASVAVIASAVRHDKAMAANPVLARLPSPVALPTKSATYLGVYADQVPQSYSGVTAFTRATRVRPSLVAFYSGWLEGFPASFAAAAAKEGAVPLVQIQPNGVKLAAIAAGRYDGYLRSYAGAVRAYGHPVIVSFGHEMNGSWYTWGYLHTSPTTFVAAWRQVVSVFRSVGADNVTWLWTVNIINAAGRGKIPNPAPWWPGSSYVNWVGIDGYYFQASWKFAPLFGPTISAVRLLTSDPILISETAAPSTADQANKVADLFAGVRSYGLLGFVWFDSIGSRNWRLSNSAAAAFRKGARTFERTSP